MTIHYSLTIVNLKFCSYNHFRQPLGLTAFGFLLLRPPLPAAMVSLAPLLVTSCVAKGEARAM